jgi:hypothetical protein
MIKILLIYLSSFAFLSGCNYQCSDRHITPLFIGFLPADLDTLIFKAYVSNDNYQHLVKTITVIASQGAGIDTTANDTTVIKATVIDPTYYITPGYDWQIYIPAKNRTVSISNIVSPQSEGHSKGCWNPINSLVQDSQLVVPQFMITPDYYTTGYRVVIQGP